MPDAMPRELKKGRNLWDDLGNAASHMANKLVPDDRQISYDKIVDCYWSKKDRQDIAFVMDTLVSNSKTNAVNFQLTREVTLENEALPLPLKVTIQFVMREPDDAKGVLWPKELMLQAEAYRVPLPEIDTIAMSIAECAFNRGLLKQTVDWLRNNCKTHQQACTLFPAWSIVLRYASATELANRCEERASALPPLPPFMRQKLRYLNNLMGMHMLMETFSKPVQMADPNLCTMRMAGDMSVQQEVGDATHWVKFYS